MLNIPREILKISSPSERPRIYVAQYDPTVWVDLGMAGAISNLNITYNTKAGDNVLFEFTYQITLDIVDSSTTLQIYFEIDGVPPDSKIVTRGYLTDNLQPIYNAGAMRHHIQNSTAGVHNVQVVPYINDNLSATNLKYCVLTVIVF